MAGSGPVKTDKIILKGMVFRGFHGYREEERRLGQQFVVDLEIHLDLKAAGRSDRIEDTIDYVEIYQVVKRLVEGPGKFLLETLAEEISREITTRFDRVQRVLVTVRKPQVPMPGILDYVAVQVERGKAR